MLKTTVFLLLYVLLLPAVLLAGCKRTPPVGKPSAASAPAVAPAAAPAETALVVGDGWVTYTGKAGFSLSVPKDWDTKEYPTDFMPGSLQVIVTKPVNSERLTVNYGVYPLQPKMTPAEAHEKLLAWLPTFLDKKSTKPFTGRVPGRKSVYTGQVTTGEPVIGFFYTCEIDGKLYCIDANDTPENGEKNIALFERMAESVK